ncbi:MAG: hypothetical protein AABY32_04480 [Nanoarchaeota archaeon]
MKEPLEIWAINVRGMLPNEHATFRAIGNENYKRILNILEKCSDSGCYSTLGEEKDKKLQRAFMVEQILYRGQWERFENYKKNSPDRVKSVDFHNYIMSFEEFQRKGRLKKIYLDFHNSVSLEE